MEVMESHALGQKTILVLSAYSDDIWFEVSQRHEEWCDQFQSTLKRAGYAVHMEKGNTWQWHDGRLLIEKAKPSLIVLAIDLWTMDDMPGGMPSYLQSLEIDEPALLKTISAFDVVLLAPERIGDLGLGFRTIPIGGDNGRDDARTLLDALKRSE